MPAFIQGELPKGGRYMAFYKEGVGPSTQEDKIWRPEDQLKAPETSGPASP